MAIRSRSSGTSAASTSHSPTLPSGITAGDRLVVEFVNDDGTATATTSSTGWSSLGTATQGSNHRLTVFTKQATGSDTLVVALSSSNEASYAAAAMIGDGGTPTVQFNSGASATTGAVTSVTGLSGDYDSIVGLGLDNSAGTSHTVTPPSGWANVTTAGTSSDPVIASIMDDSFTAVTSISPANVTWTNAEQWITANIAIPLAPVPLPSPLRARRRTPPPRGRRGAFWPVPTGADPNFPVVSDSATATDAYAIVDSVAITDTFTATDTFTVFDNQPQSTSDTTTVTDTFDVFDVPRSSILGAQNPGVTYEVLVVARIPTAAAPPSFLIVDPIQWTELEWTTSLSAPQSFDLTCSISTLTEPVLQRFRRPAALATELWLLRNGQTVFAGPLATGQRDGETLKLHADGLLAYLARMIIYSDLVYSNVDQALIVKGLVDHWQNRPYGNFGIDTSTVGAVGVTRDATYLRTELHPILQRVQELGKRESGFDVDVDPVSRQLQVWYPQRGVDRSTGEDAVVFDARNITRNSTMFSVTPGDVASIAFGTGTSSDNTTGTLYAGFYNTELLPQFGASAITGTWDSVKEQTTLDQHVQALLLARKEALFVPGPNVRVTPDADRSSYDAGDTVHMDVDDQLGVNGAFRLRSLKVAVSRAGQELVSPQFV